MARGKSTGGGGKKSAGKARNQKGRASEEQYREVEEKRVVDPRGAKALQRGAATATGQELAKELYGEEIPKGADRGAELDEAAKGIEVDGKPKGLQAEPALLLSNGTMEPRTVATPSGPVPVAAVSSSVQDADDVISIHEQKLFEQAGPLYSANEELPDHVIDGMSAAELRAVATHRGYDVGSGGTGTTRAAFKRQQSDDEGLKNQK